MTRNYTRKGDGGTTALFGGGRVSKSHPLVVALGKIDAVNADLGLARSFLADKTRPRLETLGTLDEILEKLQHELFRVGADLAAPHERKTKVDRMGPEHTAELERLIDTIDTVLPELRAFVLPGGTKAAAFLHRARADVRDAETAVVLAKEQGENINPHLLTYLNRLSSLLFVLARWANHAERHREVHPRYP